MLRLAVVVLAVSVATVWLLFPIMVWFHFNRVERWLRLIWRGVTEDSAPQRESELKESRR